MSQLAFSFDIEPPQSERRKPSKTGKLKPRSLGEPYYPFDAELARQTILEQLRKAGGEWVGKRRIFRGCGMHPTDVAILVSRMEDEGVVEIGQRFWPRDKYRITQEAGHE